MATWTNIDDTFLEPGKPVRSVDGLALRDNPIAITEGAAGAPKINPIGAMAHGGNVGAVGTYAFLRTTTAVVIGPGGVRGGSGLLYAPVNAQYASGNPPGTWRLMGRVTGQNTNTSATSVWLRIS